MIGFVQKKAMKNMSIFSIEDEETVMRIDKWKNQGVLDLHHKSEMMKEIAELRNKYKLRIRVERYIDL